MSPSEKRRELQIFNIDFEDVQADQFTLVQVDVGYFEISNAFNPALVTTKEKTTFLLSRTNKILNIHDIEVTITLISE